MKTALTTLALFALVPTAFAAQSFDQNQCSCISNQVAQMGQTQLSGELSQIFTQMESPNDPNSGAFASVMGELSSNQYSWLTPELNLYYQLFGSSNQQQTQQRPQQQSMMGMQQGMQQQQGMQTGSFFGTSNQNQSQMGMTSSPSLYSMNASGYNQNQMYAGQMYAQPQMYTGQMYGQQAQGGYSNGMSSGLSGGLSLGMNLGLTGGFSL